MVESTRQDLPDYEEYELYEPDAQDAGANGT